MKVYQCMKLNAISIKVEATVQDAAKLLVSHHIGTLPVVDEAYHLVGILHLRDMLKLVMPSFVNMFSDFDFVRSDFGVFEEATISAETAVKPIRDLLEPPVSVLAESGLLRAFAILDKHKAYDLPVVDENDRLVGIASRVDVGTALLTSWQKNGLSDKSL